ncbi:MAG TPA: hypothetical protein VHD87_15505 [Acidimicrobiales bacterium]|nr:hypothetical protein [Acidimicrobiales bacterium]
MRTDSLRPPKKKSARQLWAEHVSAGLCRCVLEDRSFCPERATHVPVITARRAQACDADEPEHDWSAHGDPMCPPHATAVAESWASELWQPDGAPDGYYVDWRGTEWWHPTVSIAPAPAE